MEQLNNPTPTPNSDTNNNPIPSTNPPVPKKKWNKPTGKYIGDDLVILIKALKELGHSDTEIARRLKGRVGKTSIHFLAKAEIHNQDMIERIKKYAANHWWLTKHNALSAITPEKLMDSSALQLATIAGISTEKARLIEGDSTVNLALVNESDRKLEEDINQLEYELASIKGEEVAVQKGSVEIDDLNRGEEVDVQMANSRSSMDTEQNPQNTEPPILDTPLPVPDGNVLSNEPSLEALQAELKAEEENNS